MNKLIEITDIKRSEDSGEYLFKISDETRDRHGTIIKLSAWQLDNFNRAGIAFYQHETSGDMLSGADPDSALGPARAFIQDGALWGAVRFEPAEINPKADKIRQKIDFGTLRAASVGFNSTAGHWGEKRSGEDPDTYYFDSAELLEFSIVNIPSNPNALKRYADELVAQLPEKPKEKAPAPNRRNAERLRIKKGRRPRIF